MTMFVLGMGFGACAVAALGLVALLGMLET